MNFELKYGTKAHTKIREALRNRLRHADNAISKKTTDYRESEEIALSYLPERDVEALQRAQKRGGDPKYVTMAIPYSYAVLMSWHTYISTVFLSRSPIQQFTGRHGETEQQIQAVEAIMDYQTQVGEHLAPYYVWFMDAGKYGVGILGNYWVEEMRQVSEIVEEEATYLGIKIAGKTVKKKRTRRVPGYQGNKVFNVRPQDFFHDGRVSLINLQHGEYCGRYTDLGWNHIIRRAASGQYYNIEDLRRVKKNKRQAGPGGGSSTGRRDLGSSQMQLPEAITKEAEYLLDDFETPDFIEVAEIFVELIPKDWGLGKSNYPEKWVFTLAEDEVIIESQPYDSLHGKFPFSVIEAEIEGYGLFKRSMLEMLDPLNDTMEWLVNTHFYNVRANQNGQFIADPSRIVMKDFRSEGGGRIIRLKPTAYGQDIRSMFMQIPVADVTQNHLRDVQAIGDLIQRVSGVTDNIMGMVNSGGRKTATEVRSSNAFGSNRLKTQSEYFSATGFAPNAMMLLANTQQKYSGEQKFRIAGDLMEEAAQFMEVNREMIAGSYDFVPVDGTMPIDRFAQVTMWSQLLGQMRNMPEVMQKYDMGGIFAWVAQLGGLKNIKRFRVNIVPDEQALLEAQKGNLVRTNDVRGNSEGNGRNPAGATGVPGASQIRGMGPAG